MEWEEQFMKQYNVKYILNDDGTYPTNGCFAGVIKRAKLEVVKMVNRATEKTHKGKVCVRRANGATKSDQKTKRREPGKTIGCYCKFPKDNGPDYFVLHPSLQRKLEAAEDHAIKVSKTNTYKFPNLPAIDKATIKNRLD